MKKQAEESVKQEGKEGEEEPGKKEEVEESKEPEKAQDEKEKSVSLDALIKEEIEGLKKDMKFYVFDLRMKSIVFIKVATPYKDLIDVCTLGHAIVNDIFEGKKTLTRFCMRFLPIKWVCKAKDKNTLFKHIRRETKAYFENKGAVKWSMEYKNRSNKLIHRTEILDVS